ncbi:MAG TPA: hypothetical protein P5560_10345 [Thermotogota bacterium]|nr:hypothetical protein [Thermotogota bacterium]HRW93336.1 hypothetical protein [Thermotogota bacterium]
MLRKKKWLWLFLLVGLVFLPSCNGGGILTFWIDFEALIPLTQYHVGDAIVEDGVDMKFEIFYWFPGGSTTNGYAEVQTLNKAGHIGNDLFLNNINMAFDFHTMVVKITFYAGYYGGNVNMRVNGFLGNHPDLITFNGLVLGGVNVQVVLTAPNLYQVTLTGNINAFSVGGQEFFIDHLFATE